MAFNANQDGAVSTAPGTYQPYTPVYNAAAGYTPSNPPPGGIPASQTPGGVPGQTWAPPNAQPIPFNQNGAPMPQTSPTTTPTTGSSMQAPSYVNIQDPTQSAVWQAFTQKGIMPSSQSDFQYWVDKINQTGGMSNTGNASYWTSRMAQGSGGVGDYSGKPEAGAGGASGSGAYVPGQGVAGQGSLFGANNPGSADATNLFNLLMGRATGSTPESANPNLTIDPNDPIIRNQVTAYSAQQQQAQQRLLAAQAEKAGPNANVSAEQRAGAETTAQNTSGFQAQLMNNELAARRTEIQQALSGSQGLLTNEQQMQLQEELAQLGLAQGAFQFDSNMNFMQSPLAPGAQG